MNKPVALESLRKKNIRINTLCIIINTGDEKVDSGRLAGYIEECNPLYENIFIMEEKESLKLNILGSPIRIIVNEDQKVLHYNVGSNTTEIITKELQENILR